MLLSLQGRWPDASIPCPAPRQRLVEALNDLGIRVTDSGTWIHLVPSHLYDPPRTQPRILWKQLQVRQEVEEWGAPGSRKLSETEREQIAGAIRREARPPVVYTPLGLDFDGNVENTVDLRLRLDVRKLREAGKDSVLAVWGSGIARLVYGEIECGVYRPLWDSRLFNADFLKMGHLDVDADGVEEIVLEARRGRDGLEWVIFNTKGMEVSRQEPCDSPLLFGKASSGRSAIDFAAAGTVQSPAISSAAGPRLRTWTRQRAL